MLLHSLAQDYVKGRKDLNIATRQGAVTVKLTFLTVCRRVTHLIHG